MIDSFHNLGDKPDHKESVIHSGRIQVSNNGAVLGYVAPDPNYWTPMLVPDAASALHVSFTLHKDAKSGTRLQLLQSVSSRLFASLLFNRNMIIRTIRGARYSV